MAANNQSVTAESIRDAINAVSAAESKIDVPAAVLTERRYLAGAKSDIARIIAEFAFPHDDSLRKKCTGFLSSPYQRGAEARSGGNSR